MASVTDVISSIFDSVQTSIANLSTAYRSNSNDLITVLQQISVSDLSNNEKNYYLMERLMSINSVNSQTTLELMGDDAMPYGNSEVIKANMRKPSYAEDVNYVTNYYSTKDEDKTREVQTSDGFTSYSKGEIYSRTTNLFPNELNSSQLSSSQWQVNNTRSLLYKTKKLFNQGKINTIISRFSTGGSGTNSKSTTGAGNAVSSYGMSHGRNLLKKAAEGSSDFSYPINGYNNPYCRVWTHHYQYDKLSKLIRPFMTEDEDGNGSIMTKAELHNWAQFEITKDGTTTNTTTEKEYAWKSDNEGWTYSVLNDNGFVNITPKYDGGGENNIHTKQCMFSIENLAWKDYNPYDFEKNLSYEQRGPWGGRIMWFPPYGIQFNETTQANWTNHTFIGRGEDVYTYTNTVRSGNLSFMMVVDHPSITDYVTWKHDDITVKDTDMLRFFAGCDATTVTDAARPTPLTDETTQATYEVTYTKPETAKIGESVVDEEIADEETSLVFYIFYPNNYSGVFDRDSDAVDPIAYLLNGTCAQKKTSSPMEDYPLMVNNITNQRGTGYLMGDALISDIDDEATIGPIRGMKSTWPSYISSGVSTVTESMLSSTKLWYYRIDGEYDVPTDKEKEVTDDNGTSFTYNNKYVNTYDQTLSVSSNYSDNHSGDNVAISLNISTDAVQNAWGDDSENLYSFAEVACAVINNESVTSHLTDLHSDLNTEHIEEVRDKLDNYEINSIIIEGYANSQGTNATSNVNQQRNQYLAYQRAMTAKQWLSDNNISGTTELSAYVVEMSIQNSTNVNSLEAVKARSAKVTINLSKTATTTLSSANQTATDSNGDTLELTCKYIGYTEKTDVNGTTYYVDDNKTAWIEVTDTESSHYGELVMATIDETGAVVINEALATDSSQRGTLNSTESSELNKIRYDQEYHFFRKLKQDDPIIFDALMDKLQYFDPAFHSMNPEGFNARLTFLNQCMRQGSTIGASDTSNSNGTGKSQTATNLAFGRPPFCVLRLGDFYNQMIVIDNISIQYEPLVFDLNPEGIGVQPMIANVTLSFKFIGGGDLAGPIRRLQNAMSFNYYANARLYDNRADRVKFSGGVTEQGALKSEPDIEYMHLTSTYQKNVGEKTV